MGLRQTVATAMLLLSAGATPALADVLSQTSTGVIWMCWRQDTRVTCGECDRNAPRFTRLTCQKDIEHVDAGALVRAYIDLFRASLADKEARVAAIRGHIADIDDKCLEFLAASPRPRDRTDLLGRADVLRSELAVAAREHANLLDQVRLIELRLATNPSRDLAEQLLALRGQLGVASETLAGTHADLMTTLQEFVKANGDLIDPSVFRGLQNQRNQALNDYESAQEDAESVLESNSDAVRVLKMLEDRTFIYEHIHQNYPATDREVRELGDVIARLPRV